MPSTFRSETSLLQHRLSIFEEARIVASHFDYTDSDVRKCVREFIREMKQGLRERTPTMCQTPTHVASGTEKGTSLAVDLGGTNLRVCSVELHGDTVENNKAKAA